MHLSGFSNQWPSGIRSQWSFSITLDQINCITNPKILNCWYSNFVQPCSLKRIILEVHIEFLYSKCIVVVSFSVGLLVCTSEVTQSACKRCGASGVLAWFIWGAPQCVSVHLVRPELHYIVVTVLTALYHWAAMSWASSITNTTFLIRG